MLKSAEGVEGYWTPWTFTVYDTDNIGVRGRHPKKSNYSIVSVSVRSQRPCGSCDDTATHGLRFEDSDGETYEPYTGYWYILSYLKHSLDGYWASAWCAPGTVITGFKTQVEPDQGGGDDTGLNRVAFICSTMSS